MCLYTSLHSVRRLRRKLKEKGYIIAYKRVIKMEDYKCGYGKIKVTKKYLKSLFYDHIWEPGWNEARMPKYYDYGNLYHKKQINEGIHVFLRKPKQQSEYSLQPDIAVKCYEKDLISAGHGQAVLKKVYLTKKEHQKALRK